MKKDGVFLFVISHLVPEIFKIFVLCKLGTDDIISFSSVSVYYLATISNTHHEIINTFIKLVEAARRAIRNHKAYTRWTS